ncbi:hypothetical protein Tco_1150422 [Tanacetum coccineum]
MIGATACLAHVLWFHDDYQKIKSLGINEEELLDYFGSYNAVRVSHSYGLWPRGREYANFLDLNVVVRLNEYFEVKA